MIVPESMTKIRIAAPRSYSYKMINTLYRLNLMHVKEYAKGELDGLDAGAPLVQAEAISGALLNLRSLKSEWGIGEQPGSAESEVLTKNKFDALNGKINLLKESTKKLLVTIKDKEQLHNSLNKKAAVAEALKTMDIDVSLVPKMRFVFPFIGTVKEYAPLRERMEKSFDWHAMKAASAGGEKLVALFVKRENELAARTILNDSGFVAIELDDYKNVAAAQLRKNSAAAEKELSAARHSLVELKKTNKKFMLENEQMLEEEIKKAELPLQFATTAKSLIATGYVPENEIHKIKDALKYAADGNIMIEEEEPEHEEPVPIKLNNPKGIKNFEFLTRLYELPQYLEVDPSILLAFTFPLFFGFMLGDVGYGIVTLAIMAYLKKKIKDVGGRQLLNVLIYAAIASILFGFVFGEYFGFEHVSKETGESWCGGVGLCLHKEVLDSHGKNEMVYSFPRLIARTHDSVSIAGYDILAVLFIGALVGAVHLNLGFLIGFYNVWRAHGIKHAVLEKLSWLVLEAGLVLLVMSLTGFISLHFVVGAVLMAAAAAMLYLGEGPKGVIEIPALFSNMLSYMRLGAVGLASVGLAVVINENLAKPFLEKGGFFIVIALIIMIIGHLVNIGLGVLGPFLHGIRLHYVEFFSKFFYGGGQEYRPFGYKKVTGGGE